MTGLIYLAKTSFQVAGTSTACGSKSREAMVCCRWHALTISSVGAPGCRLCWFTLYISRFPPLIARGPVEPARDFRFSISIRFSTPLQSKLFRWCVSVAVAAAAGNQRNWVDFRVSRRVMWCRQEVVERATEASFSCSRGAGDVTFRDRATGDPIWRVDRRTDDGRTDVASDFLFRLPDHCGDYRPERRVAGLYTAARRRAAAASISDRLSWSLPASLPPPLGRVRRRGRLQWLTALSSRPAECIHLVAYWAVSRRVNGDGDGVMLPCRYLSTSSFQRTTTLHVVTANVALILHRCAAVPPSHVDRGRAVYTRLSALERRCIWASVHAETRSFYSSCSRLVKIILDTLWAYKVAINAAWTLDAACPACHFWLYIHLYSPYNMVTANNTKTSKNTTNEKKIMTVPLHTQNKALNSQYSLQILNHLA